MVIDSNVRCCGLKVPFFPMRPTTGRRITPDTFHEFAPINVSGYAVQPKLNGDRALLAVVESGVLVANRYGAWFKHPVLNRQLFKNLGVGTILDGEVWERNYYPFEAVALGGTSFQTKCPTVRIQQAKLACTLLDLQWMFETPTLAWITKQVAQNYDNPNPTWEGLVFKKLGSAYIPLGSASMDSPTWRKHKWSKG